MERVKGPPRVMTSPAPVGVRTIHEPPLRGKHPVAPGPGAMTLAPVSATRSTPTTSGSSQAGSIVGSVKAIAIHPRTGVLMGGVSPTGDSYVMGW